MECRRENLHVQHIDLDRTERHLLKEMGFICHVEHPHKFICNYLATLETQELSQEAWNLANDSLRTTLCVRFKSQVIACGVVPLPENPPWWKAFDAEKHQIDEVCRVLAHLYHRPKARYISVCKDGETNKLWDSKSESFPNELHTNGSSAVVDEKSVETRDSKGEAILASERLMMIQRA
ncbi:hypothetical protein QQ045_001043 [Rhodiola kirilowii]